MPGISPNGGRNQSGTRTPLLDSDGVSAEETSGQHPARFGVQLDARYGHVLLEVAHRGRGRGSGAPLAAGSSSQAKATGAGLQPRRAAVSVTGGLARTGLPRAKPEPSGKNGTKAMPRGMALLEHRQGAPVRQVHQILHAGDVGDGERVPEVVAGGRYCSGRRRRSGPSSRAFTMAASWSSNLLISRASSIKRKLTTGEAVRRPGCAGCPRFLPELGRPVVPGVPHPMRPGGAPTLLTRARPQGRGAALPWISSFATSGP